MMQRYIEQKSCRLTSENTNIGSKFCICNELDSHGRPYLMSPFTSWPEGDLGCPLKVSLCFFIQLFGLIHIVFTSFYVFLVHRFSENMSLCKLKWLVEI